MGLLDDAIREHLDLKRRRGADPADVERAEREALGPVRRAPTSQSVEVADQQQPEAGSAYDHEDEFGWTGDPRDVPPRASGTARRGRDLEPDFDDEPFDEPPTPAEPPQRPSRLARIFGRADPEPEPEPELAEPELHDPRFDDSRFDDSRFEDPALTDPALGDHALRDPALEDPEFEEPAPMPPPTRAPRPSEPLDSPEQPESHRSTPPPRAAPAPQPAGGEGDETTEYEVEPAPHPEPPPEGEDVLEETPEFLQDTPDHDRLWFEQRPPKDFDFNG